MIEKLFQLKREAWQSIAAQNFDDAKLAADAIVAHVQHPDFPPIFRNNGNALYCAYTVLGLVAIHRKQTNIANEMLSLAGNVPSSPHLASFGPNLQLADKLLRQGEIRAVVEFLNDCRKIWDLDYGNIDKWIEQIENGEIPDFGANLVYEQ